MPLVLTIFTAGTGTQNITCNVTGGIGVFGSLATGTVSIYIERNP